MSHLLELRTKPYGNDKQAHVRLLGDGIATDTGSDWGHLFAMSVTGPEEAIRAIHAGCAMRDREGKPGCIVDILGAGYALRCLKWAGDFDCRVLRLKDGPIHMVAWSNQLKIPTSNGMKIYRVVYPETNSIAHRDAAIYAALQQHYTTPLIPSGVTGQPPEEAAIGALWRDRICAAVAADQSYWYPLRRHPGADNLGLPNHWAGCGVLKIEQPELDKIVCNMVKCGLIKIPAKAGRELAAIAG